MDIQALKSSLKQEILGQEQLVEYSLACILAGGHLLLEGPPGLGKTSLAQALAQCFSGSFRRLQMTSDLLPSDIVGVLRFIPGKSELEFRPGPIFSQVLLADELNRASPKTQAALLEAMAEGKTSVDGVSYELPKPFFVIATQNPQEFQGVYPLAESQLDRFMLELPVTLPEAEQELSVYRRELKGNTHKKTESPLSAEDFLRFREQVKNIHVEESVLRYAQAVAQATRTQQELRYGVSVRGVIQWLAAAQALSFLRGKDFVSPKVLQELAPAALAHRICFVSAEKNLSERREFLSLVLSSVKEPR